MKVEANYRSGLEFEVVARGHKVVMDTKAPLGRDHGPSPKEMLLGSILVCSGMDVAAHLRKHRLNTTKFSLRADATPRSEHPTIFPRIDVQFEIEGEGLDTAIVKEAVELSMTMYCGVSAMVAPTSPIFYEVRVNGETLATGKADF